MKGRLWEENGNMTPKIKNEKQKEKITNSIIYETEKKFSKKECLNIGKVWKRICPKCGKTLYHTEKWVRDRFVRLNKNCGSCSNHNKVRGGLLGSTKQILSIQRKGKRPSLSARLNMSKSQIGRKHSEETKRKMSGENNGMYDIHRYGKLNPFSGKKHTEESRKKMRVAMLSKIKERYGNGFLANVGTKESSFLEKLEKERNWNGIYYGKSKTQHFINELGYIVDYYEPNLNIVVEYDEPRHYVNGQLKEKDIKRMTEITQHLGCRFYRYNERTKELKEYQTGKSS